MPAVPEPCVLLFAGEAAPLALALFAFLGCMLILVVAPLSIWKIGRLFQYSCCPEVVLPDTLVISLPSPLPY